jgi:hypothetical protein
LFEYLGPLIVIAAVIGLSFIISPVIDCFKKTILWIENFIGVIIISILGLGGVIIVIFFLVKFVKFAWVF